MYNYVIVNEPDTNNDFFTLFGTTPINFFSTVVTILSYVQFCFLSITNKKLMTLKMSHGPCSSLHEFCELNIFCRQPTTVVRAQRYLHSAVHIKPFWMVIHLFRRKGHAGHKTKCLVEILEFKFLVNSITPLDFCPA